MKQAIAIPRKPMASDIYIYKDQTKCSGGNQLPSEVTGSSAAMGCPQWQQRVQDSLPGVWQLLVPLTDIKYMLHFEWLQMGVTP